MVRDWWHGRLCAGATPLCPAPRGDARAPWRTARAAFRGVRGLPPLPPGVAAFQGAWGAAPTGQCTRHPGRPLGQPSVLPAARARTAARAPRTLR